MDGTRGRSAELSPRGSSGGGLPSLAPARLRLHQLLRWHQPELLRRPARLPRKQQAAAQARSAQGAGSAQGLSGTALRRRSASVARFLLASRSAAGAKFQSLGVATGSVRSPSRCLPAPGCRLALPEVGISQIPALPPKDHPRPLVLPLQPARLLGFLAGEGKRESSQPCRARKCGQWPARGFSKPKGGLRFFAVFLLFSAPPPFFLHVSK